MIDITEKQYLISNHKIKVAFKNEIKLSCGAYLYTGADIKISCCRDLKNREYIIVGNAFNVDTPEKSVEDSVADFKGDNINDLVYTWTGRWIIISGNKIQIDAAGGMSAFYTTSQNWCISSSLALISVVTGKKVVDRVQKFGINWQILPYTILDGVKALLCTQTIEIENDALKIKYNPWVQNYTELSTEEKVKKISNCLKNGLINISRYSDRDIWIALTAGKDSRLVLAAALSAKIKFYTYTFEHDACLCSDKKIPKKISEDFGIPYFYIKRKKLILEKSLEYESFSLGNSLGTDEMFYSMQQTEQIPENAMVIRGGFFEAAQSYARKISGETLMKFADGLKNYYSEDFKDQRQTEALNEWVKYIEDNNISFIDIRDRFYIEQRVGGWGNAIEQSLCINKWDSLQLANSRVILSVLLSANKQERDRLALSFDSISYLEPKLMNYDFNKVSLNDRLRLYIKVLSSKDRLKRNINKFVKWKKN